MASFSIVICTLSKSALAKESVLSALGQHLNAEASLNVIAVDNSPQGLAKSWIGELARNDNRLRYIHEPRPGISHARNAGVAASNADFLAFLDDDETAEADWLMRLHDALEAHNGDVATGPVHPVFENKEALGWDPEPFFYGRRERLPTGSELEAGRTGNVLFRAKTCFTEKPPFDPEFALSGGEDTLFTHSLFNAGRKIIWVAEAHVHELWPLKKASLGTFLQRKLITARNTTRARLKCMSQPRLGYLKLVPKALLQILIFLPPSAVLYFWNRQVFAKCAMQVMSATGKLTYWHHTKYYGSQGEMQS